MEIQTRTKKQFLFLPKTINGKTKWLCFATFEEQRILEKTFNTINTLLGGAFMGKVHTWEWSAWKATKWL